MHHFPASKGDSLCPLGFHPQVRWPTRCKRCFRDYKEHYNRNKKEDNSLRKDATTGSTPSISNNSKSDYPRSWVSSDNLYEGKLENELTEYKSTLDLVNLDDNSPSVTTVNFRLPKRRSSTDYQSGKDSDTKNDKNKSLASENSSLSKTDKDSGRIQIKEVKKKPEKASTEGILENHISHLAEIDSNNGLDQPLAQLRKKLTQTQDELEITKQKCDRLEKEKREVILRRLPSMDTNKSNSEFNKLQQKCNELQKEVKGYTEEKSNLQLKIRILEDETRRYPKEKVSNNVEELRSKLKAAESLCEELMDENESLKKDVRDMEEQIDEIQDNFREDQIAEYTSLKAELEQTTKNCRILSFKLKKAEKRNEQFELEKQHLETKLKDFSENQTSAHSLEKIKKLEQELADSASVSTKLQTEVGLLNKKLSELESTKSDVKGNKSKNTEVKKISRQSLIRSGSQEEPIVQAQVPDTSEIERDLREQLKFSEEEAENLRKTVSRIENDNELLLMQLKKLNARIRNKPGIAKDIMDDDELKLQLELTEQEITPIKGKTDFEKPVNRSQAATSKRISEDRTNKKLVEYEQQIKELKENIEEEKLKNKQKQTELTKSVKKWENESKKLKTQVESLEETNKNLSESIKTQETTIAKLEKKISSGRALLRTAQQTEILNLKTELEQKNSEYTSLQNQLSSARALEAEANRKLKDIQAEKEKADQDYDKKTKQLENDIKGEKKKAELLKKESETRNSELRTLKLQMNKKDPSIENKLQTKIDELNELNKKISIDFSDANKKLNDLTSKHEDLEEEFSLTKAKLDVEKESLNSELQTIKQRLNNLIAEKRELEEEFEQERNTWLMEKLRNQEKLKKTSSNTNDSNDLDKMRFNSLIAEKQSEVEKYKKENESLSYQIDYMKGEMDEMKSKLDDYEKVNKVQRNISADSSALEKEVREMKKKLELVEKSRKTDVLKCKMGYEEQLATVNNELKLLQSQIIRYKKEKDTYKNMLQSAQKSMGDLKFKRDTNKFEVPNVKTDTLEAQYNSLEDEHSEIKLEYSKLKTQLVSDKSNYEVKILEMQTRINELEEEKILNSGRTKIAGLRTCMELSWQKEREEQQRLLQETATLARDLRQTLFEVEKERDKERLEAKRKFEQLKKAIEEDQSAAKKKIKDLQCDLLELRDAHAKLRTTNERLKREKDRMRRDEDSRAKSLSRTNLDDPKDVSTVLQHIDTLKCLANEVDHLDGEKRGRILTPEDKKDKLDNVVSSLLNISQDLFSQMREIEREKLMIPRRRTRPETTLETASKLNRQGSLKRRSLSLEQTSTLPREQNIWQADQGSMSSLRSANSDLDVYDNMSDTSIQSDLAEKKKKKKGIIGKIKKMTKSRSVDEGDSGILSNLLGKKPSSLENLNNTITGIFRRAGSSSRSNSVERTKPPEPKYDSSSRQRPLMKMKSESPAR